MPQSSQFSSGTLVLKKSYVLLSSHPISSGPNPWKVGVLESFACSRLFLLPCLLHSHLLRKLMARYPWRHDKQPHKFVAWRSCCFWRHRTRCVKQSSSVNSPPCCIMISVFALLPRHFLHAFWVSKPILLQWLNDYQALLAGIRSSVQQRRLQAWRKSLVSSDGSLSSRAFNWLSGPPKVWDGVVHSPSGPVYSKEASFDMLSGFWKQFWCKHQSGQSWEAGLCIVASLNRPTLDLPPLSGSDLRSALKRSRPTSAAGSDGWSHGELSILPHAAFQALADVWNSLERTQLWEHDLFTWSVGQSRALQARRLQTSASLIFCPA